MLKGPVIGLLMEDRISIKYQEKMAQKLIELCVQVSFRTISFRYGLGSAEIFCFRRNHKFELEKTTSVCTDGSTKRDSWNEYCYT